MSHTGGSHSAPVVLPDTSHQSFSAERDRLSADNAALRERCKVLEEALRPFVQTAIETKAYGSNGRTIVRVRDCRAARKAMHNG